MRIVTFATDAVRVAMFPLGILMGVAGIVGMAAYPLLFGEVHHVLVSHPIIKTSLETRTQLFFGCSALSFVGVVVIFASGLRGVRRI